MAKLVEDVFGVSNDILKDSYVDRGALDASIARDLRRRNHVAIRGASKTGKSWIRQKLLPDAIVVQCRLGKTLTEIYTEALGQLDIKLVTQSTRSSSYSGTIEAESEIGAGLIGKVKAKLGLTREAGNEETLLNLKVNIHDLKFISEILLASERRLVIEDFHYLSREERSRLAFDLKAMWDYGLFVVVVGVWSDNNLLLHINPDLSGRVREVSIVWNNDDLRQIITRGTSALNVTMPNAVITRLVAISYGNAGILQRLTLDTLDRAGLMKTSRNQIQVGSHEDIEAAALFYAEELNSIYLEFAKRVSRGIRTRADSTGIYAHAMAVALDASDDELMAGVHIDKVYEISHARESRIHKGNLRTALGNIEKLQVDKDGRGLVLSFADERVRVVDHQVLLYRAYATVRWPWDDMILEADATGEDYGLVAAE